MSNLPAEFRQRMQAQLGQKNSLAFETALTGSIPVSIQRNPYKVTNEPGTNRPIPWHADGEYLPSRPVFTLDPDFQAGAYYVQEASSMFVGWLARQHLPQNRPWKILDLCAAPGGKSCLLASVMPAGSLLVSNEVIKNRYGILKYNLAKWGLDNCWTTNLDPERFADLSGFFDLVVVDAPCSGEGMFRKDPNAIKEWSPEHVELCGLRQERILAAAAPLVSKDGILIYSTCTYNRRENEQQIDWLKQRQDFEVLNATPPPEWKINYENSSYRFYPHQTEGEGFFAFAARPTRETGGRYKKKRPGHWVPLKKSESGLAESLLENPRQYDYHRNKAGMIYAIDQRWAAEMEILVAALGRIDLGFPVGEVKGKQIVPAAELALHTARRKDLASYSVERATALRLLKKETPPLPGLERGWHLITYNGNGLLWVKGLGNRYNNYYPAGWRIRMEVK